MRSRQRAWPRLWLMTDERLGDRLWDAIARLPDGESGIVFRHYGTRANEREVLARDVAALCRQRRITLGVADDVALAQAVRADFVHRPADATDLPFSLTIHDPEEAAVARRRKPALTFVSPIFPTRSHPDRPGLGPEKARLLAEASGTLAIALGGMDAARFASLQPGAFHGWAAIDAWLRDLGG